MTQGLKRINLGKLDQYYVMISFQTQFSPADVLLFMNEIHFHLSDTVDLTPCDFFHWNYLKAYPDMLTLSPNVNNIRGVGKPKCCYHYNQYDPLSCGKLLREI